MPTAIRLVPRPDPNAISDETRQAHQSVGDFDLLLERLLAGVQASFSYMWGHKGNPRPRATQENGQVGIIELLNEAIKSDVITAINTYFSLELWDFGDTFYFTELAAYIHNQLAPDLLSVVIVPAQNPNGFGSLFEINSEDNQILISSATVDNVEIITSITADKLKATGTVVTSSTVTASTTSTVSSVSDTTTSSGSSGGYY